MRNFKLKSLFLSALILSVFFISQAALADPLLLRDNIPAFQSAKICVSPTKNIYVVWRDSGSVSFNKSVDGGATFDNKMILHEPVDDEEFMLKPEIGVNDDGTIFIFYAVKNSHGTSSAFSFFMATSSDEGETFETRIIHHEENGEFSIHEAQSFSRTDLKIIDGAIYFSVKWDGCIVLARSLDGGTSFEPFTVAEKDETLDRSRIYDYSIGIDTKGVVYAVYTDEYYKEGDNNHPSLVYDVYFTLMKSGQNAFEPPRIIGGCHISRSFSGEYMEIPRIVISSEDKIGIIWSETEIIPRGDNRATIIKPYYYRISSDGGESFTEPVKLNFGDDQEGWVRARDIVVERDRNDVIHFLYWGKNGNISYAKSTDFFQSFSLAEQVITTDDAPWFIDFIPVSGSEIYLTWSEYNPDDEKHAVDIFFSSLTGDPFENHPDNTDPTSTQGGNGGGGGGGCFIDSII